MGADPASRGGSGAVAAAAVLHFCMRHQVAIQPGRLNVMFDVSRIASEWVAHNRRHDVVVVPTESSRRAWLAAEFPDERIGSARSAWT